LFITPASLRNGAGGSISPDDTKLIFSFPPCIHAGKLHFLTLYRKIDVDLLRKKDDGRSVMKNTPPATLESLDTFTRAYLACALWSSTDSNELPMDQNYSLEDLSPEALQQAVDECAAFVDGACLDEWTDEQSGNDFWLTRNRHGAGFWDRGLPNGDKLTEWAHTFGSCDLYVGDDGKIHMS
jgi:hypothetical protein